MLKTQRLTREFMEKCELTTSNFVTTDIEYGKLTSLVAEEYNEFYLAMNELHRLSDDDVYTTKLIDVIDALCDLIVVIHNVSNAMGIDLEPFFDEVHKKNMEKQGGLKREDGKQLKPEGWTPPDHESILKRIIGVEIDKQYNLCSEKSSDVNGPSNEEWKEIIGPIKPIDEQFPAICAYCEGNLPVDNDLYVVKHLYGRLICNACLDMHVFGGAPRLIPTEDKALEARRTSFVKHANRELEKRNIAKEKSYTDSKGDNYKLPTTNVVITPEQSIFEKLAEATGKLVTEKNAAYGDSVRTSGKIMQLLYPEGIAFDQIPAALLTVRVLDKLSRIANDPKYGGEDPAQDITGYGLLLMELVKNGL